MMEAILSILAAIIAAVAGVIATDQYTRLMEWFKNRKSHLGDDLSLDDSPSAATTERRKRTSIIGINNGDIILNSEQVDYSDVQNYIWNLKYSKGENSEIASSSEDFCDFIINAKSQKFLVFAQGGYGKSTLLAHSIYWLEKQGYSIVHVSISTLIHQLHDVTINQVFVFIDDMLRQNSKTICIFDGIDDIEKSMSSSKAASVIRELLYYTPPGQSKTIYSARPSGLERILSTADYLPLHTIEIEKWSTEQAANFLDKFKLPLPSNDVLELIRVPFYARIYMDSNPSVSSTRDTKFQLIQSYIQQELSKYKQLNHGASWNLLELNVQIAWHLRTSRSMNLERLDQLTRAILGEDINTETIRKLPLISIGELSVDFVHELYSDYFVSLRITNDLEASGKLRLLSLFQTTYQEDLFIAERVDHHQGLATILLDNLTNTSNMVQLVNVVGILAKMKSIRQKKLALTIVKETPELEKIYEQAVSARLFAGEGEFDQRTRLIGEVEGGRDPVATFFALKGLKDESDFYSLLAKAESRHGIAYGKLFLEGDNFNAAST